MKAYIMTHKGLVREQNEDTALADEENGLYILADGMGGHKAGEVASALATACLQQTLAGAKPSVKRLREAIAKANAAIYEKQQGDESLSGMGTTLTVLWEKRDHVLLGHVGDSRAYLFANGRLRQLSEDHSMVGEMVRAGVLSPEAARSHPYRHVITRAVGTDPAVRADVGEFMQTAGEKWLLCSDGLTDFVEDSEIEEVLSACQGQEAAQALIDLALQGGGRDNVSVIVLEVGA